MDISQYNSPVCFSSPRRMTIGSGWLEHIPFGMFLVDLLRPQILVELGTHKGDSYCAFCQAVDELGLDTRCYAVDTWTGDSHSGRYGPEVLENLRNHHDPLYGKFSRLLKCTFDQALDMFEDGSVDLLHIDGHHSYESVKHDFETWLPKLSERGVVLFHDISVRKDDFGVWKFWGEIAHLYPSFSFVHGFGLGVLGVGGYLPTGVMQLLNSSSEGTESIRRSFYELGRALSLRVEAKKEIAEAESMAVTRVLQRRYERAKDKVLPLNTKRRKLYSWLYFNANLLIERGWRSFFWLKVRPYWLWILKNEPTESALREMHVQCQVWSYRPLVSIVTPVFNPTRYALTHCLQSVVDQIYDHWELCIVDGGSDRPYVKEIIERNARKDSRIKYLRLETNRGIAGNSNEALKLASGEYVGFLDHDDTLAPFALYEVVKVLNEDEMPDLLYSDEDMLPARGTRRFYPNFKSSWAPDTFLSGNYLCHFLVVKKNIIDALGGFREGYDGSQDYDLILRVVEKTQAIRRIPKVLYHWRKTEFSAASGIDKKPYAVSAAKRAIADHLTRRGLEGEILDGMWLGSYRVKYRLKPSQSVSIIIPTRDMLPLLRECVSSVLAKTDYEHFTIILIDNGSSERETFEYFDSLKGEKRVRILPYPNPFNFSAMNNYAVRSSDADYFVFLNNDTEVINGDWLQVMLEFAQRSDVGAVGAKLYYPNDRIQHAGIIIGNSWVAVHPHRHFLKRARGYMGRINVIQNLSAVTGACLMVRQGVFEEVGGFDEELAVSFNDVDLCMKIRSLGYLIVYTPYAELYHHESVSRGDVADPDSMVRLEREVSFMKTKWKDILEKGDPYFNPNLTLDSQNFDLRI